jgi:hypothetical protein
MSMRELALMESLADFSMRQPGEEIRRMVDEGVNVEVESQREE